MNILEVEMRVQFKGQNDKTDVMHGEERRSVKSMKDKRGEKIENI